MLLFVALSSSGRAQITAQEYEQRRATLATRLPDGLFVIRGGESPVQDYLAFYQNNGFLYLTGYREPDAALILQKKGNDRKWTLFVQTKIPSQEVWSGRRYGPDSASKATGLPTKPIGDGTETGKVRFFAATVDSLLRLSPKLSFHADIAEVGDTLNNDDRFLAELRRTHPGLEVTSANPLVTEMRSKKSAAEMDLIHRAAAISMEAHAEAARALEPGMNEFEIQALLEYTFRRYGADRPAYASIVGSGPNSTVLHYNRDDRYMKAGDLLLIDAGASFGGYAADITRTFPVSGRFTPEQREIYQVVRDAQAAAERAAKPGASWRDVSRAASTEIASGLARLGLIESPGATYRCGGSDAQPRECSQVGLYYMHSLGHGIGLAVHDPDQKDRDGIAVGSAYSIEPGIYVREELLDIIPKAGNAALLAKIGPAVRKYANTGIRIEDNYIVTEQGVKWISCVAREADEVEALMREPVKGPGVRDVEKVQWYGSSVVDPKVAKPNASPAPKACNPRM